MVVLAVVLALLIKAFLLQVYVVQGRSMFPTLHDHDWLLVNRLVYRLREPAPGEIVVFADPQPNQQLRTLIKRVIAVAGDRVQMTAGKLYVNGRLVDESAYLHLDKSEWDPQREQPPFDVPIYTLGAGELFVMGDNRWDSFDSRDPGLRAAKLTVKQLYGKAMFRFWPMGGFGPLPVAPWVYAEAA